MKIGTREWIALAAVVAGFGVSWWLFADAGAIGFWIVGALLAAALYAAGVKQSAAGRILKDGDKKDGRR